MKERSDSERLDWLEHFIVTENECAVVPFTTALSGKNEVEIFSATIGVIYPTLREAIDKAMEASDE